MHLTPKYLDGFTNLTHLPIKNEQATTLCASVRQASTWNLVPRSLIKAQCLIQNMSGCRNVAFPLLNVNMQLCCCRTDNCNVFNAGSSAYTDRIKVSPMRGSNPRQPD
ncbi:hypothetical protein QR680_014027 [Steinernema hermaphroditum]|uniref:Uncharacterized protein n=1 Tax=Steinernema hermaphroditum TaxID=289476 RepID=A0AA39I7H4_9BILA|nr:hypothetical protein QR680_014027 [Steinernema hermaphroditum]